MPNIEIRERMAYETTLRWQLKTIVLDFGAGWRKILASLPVARSVTKLGYAFDQAEVEPCYIQPLLLDLAEPSDGEIEERLGRLDKTEGKGY